MSEFKNLTLEVADGIAVLAISRPAALNALNSETLDELNVCLSEIEANDDIKAVILTGGPDKKGKSLCTTESRNDSKTTLWLSEDGILACDTDIACHRDLTSSA